MDGMYQRDERVVYGSVGVCRVVDRQQRSFGGGTEEYYVLAPESDPRSSVFVPCGNATLMERLRPLLTRTQIEAVLTAVSNGTVEWIDDRVKRREHFRRLMADGDRAQLLRLIRCLTGKKKERAAQGKSLSAADENVLRECKRQVDEEFSLVLGIPREQIADLLRERTGIVPVAVG